MARPASVHSPDLSRRHSGLRDCAVTSVSPWRQSGRSLDWNRGAGGIVVQGGIAPGKVDGIMGRVTGFFRRTGFAVSVAFASLVAVALVALSPWALNTIASVHGMNWAELSNIGQSYSAAAALLSSLALVGVALSLVAQNRDAKVAREQAVRSLHSDLVRSGMDPSLFRVVSSSRANSAPGSELRTRQRRYANLWVQYWASLHELGLITEDDLRRHLRTSLFSGDIGREYWRSIRDASIPAGSRRNRRFYRIVDDEYQKSVESGPPEIVRTEPGPEATTSQKANRGNMRGASIIGLSILGGAAIGAVFSKVLAR
jgi:hypothetical protein